MAFQKIAGCWGESVRSREAGQDYSFEIFFFLEKNISPISNSKLFSVSMQPTRLRLDLVTTMFVRLENLFIH